VLGPCTHWLNRRSHHAGSGRQLHFEGDSPRRSSLLRAPRAARGRLHWPHTHPTHRRIDISSHERPIDDGCMDEVQLHHEQPGERERHGRRRTQLSEGTARFHLLFSRGPFHLGSKSAARALAPMGNKPVPAVTLQPSRYRVCRTRVAPCTEIHRTCGRWACATRTPCSAST
jgi:hypothetical protein